MSIPNAAPLPENLTPDTGGQVDPAQLARRAQANFDALALRVGSGVRRQAVQGTTLTFPFGINAASTAVTHGFGAQPVGVFAQDCTGPFGAYAGTHLITYNFTPTTFDLYGFNLNGYNGGVVVNVIYLLSS